MITKKLKDLWTAALRSGKYEQVQGSLIIEQLTPEGDIILEKCGYCCLGVLAQINDPQGIMDWHSQEYYGEEEGLLDEEQVHSLAAMNDNKAEPYSFHKIADWIDNYVTTEEYKVDP